jgi:hypothetical protein
VIGRHWAAKRRTRRSKIRSRKRIKRKIRIRSRIGRGVVRLRKDRRAKSLSGKGVWNSKITVPDTFSG